MRDMRQTVDKPALCSASSVCHRLKTLIESLCTEPAAAPEIEDVQQAEAPQDAAAVTAGEQLPH
jgi:hypothetical protein